MGPVYFQNLKHPLNLLKDSKLDVFHWHGDRVLLPSEAELIASSEVCKEQMFVINQVAYGLQFHVEVEEHMALQWIREDIEFAHKAIGSNASSFLLKQQAKFGKETLCDRIKFINKIYDLLI